MKSVIAVRKAGSGCVIDYINDNNVKQRDYLLDMLGAIIPPSGKYPGYYLFIGMYFDRVPAGPHKLIFLDEGENHIRSALVLGMNDTAIRLSATTVYADHNNRAFFAGIWNLNPKYWLKPAASVENIEYGDALIHEIRDANVLDLPKTSILYKTLFDPVSGINDNDDLKDSKFYAFHALRFILAGIERDIHVTRETVNQHYDLILKRFHKPMLNRYNRYQEGVNGAVL